jgi:ribosomal-protein-alanine N-acetyltransferase
MTPVIKLAGEIDLDQASRFLRDNHLNYSHPDWLSQSERLTGLFTYVLEESGEILAILCTAREDPAAGWLRFFTCLLDGDHREYFNRLISASITEHRTTGTKALFSTASSEWVTNLLQRSGFVQDTEVITLAKLVDHTTSPDLTLDVRSMEFTDLEDVLTIDRLAFSPEWRLDQASLEHAFSHSAIARIGVSFNEVLAYSITNAVFGSGHLNRLAVHPNLWGQKLGEQMLWDLNTRCCEHNITHLTVNTQANNTRSIALYQRAGFRQGGESMPIYRLNLK